MAKYVFTKEYVLNFGSDEEAKAFMLVEQGYKGWRRVPDPPRVQEFRVWVESPADLGRDIDAASIHLFIISPQRIADERKVTVEEVTAPKQVDGRDRVFTATFRYAGMPPITEAFRAVIDSALREAFADVVPGSVVIEEL